VGLKDLTSLDFDSFGLEYEEDILDDPPKHYNDPGFYYYAGYHEESFEYIKQLQKAHEALGLPIPKFHFKGPGVLHRGEEGMEGMEEVLAMGEVIEETSPTDTYDDEAESPTCEACEVAWTASQTLCPEHEEKSARRLAKSRFQERL
jgi:hypothetical protein